MHEHRYILPLMVHGPNNQLGQFKHILTMARMLDRSVILPPLFEHYSDKLLGKEYAWFSLEDILDIKLLNETVRIVTADEAREEGWGGVVSASLIYLFTDDVRNGKAYDKDLTADKKRLASALEVPVPTNLTLIEWNRDICDAKGLSNLANLLDLSGYETILVLPSIVDHWRKTDGQIKTKASKSLYRPSICHDNFLAIERKFRLSEKLRLFALDFIAETFPQGQPLHVAAHVRPYRDHCLSAWANKTGDPKDPRSECDLVDLEELVANKLKAVMDRAGSRGGGGGGGLFLLAHPLIRWRINKILEPLDVTPIYLEPDSVAVQALETSLQWRKGTSSLLLLAEVAVAVLAPEFIGTHLSSATWIVVDGREAMHSQSPPQFFLEPKEERELQKLYKKSLVTHTI